MNTVEKMPSSRALLQRATVRFESEDESNPLLFELEMPDLKPPDDLAAVSSSLKLLAEEMRSMRTSMQYLVAENTLLRSRQSEREKLAQELHMQKHYASASAQLIQVTQQQAAMLDALRAFSLTFDTTLA